MNPYTFSLLFFSFCTFLIAVLIWLKRQDEVGMRYFIFCVFVGIWSSALSFVVTNQTPYGQALFCARLANMADCFIFLYGGTFYFVHGVHAMVDSRVKTDVRVFSLCSLRPGFSC